MTRRFWLSLLSALPFTRKRLNAGDRIQFDIKGTPPLSTIQIDFVGDRSILMSFDPLMPESTVYYIAPDNGIIKRVFINGLEYPGYTRVCKYDRITVSQDAKVTIKRA